MHALEDGKMHSLILLLIALLTFEPFAEANTEIINFGASYTENVTLVEAASWPSLSYEDPEHIYNVQPAALYTRLDRVCEPLVALSCPHEVWAVLELDDEAWRAFSKFTLRISWPASFPADFAIQTFSPAELSQQLGRTGSTSSPDDPDARQKTRRMYARIRAVNTGVRNPLSQAPVVSTVPFALRLEPLYLGVVPASVVPVGLFLLPVVFITGYFMAPRIHGYMASVALDAKAELAREHAKTS